jgi:hypothetical protein
MKYLMHILGTIAVVTWTVVGVTAYSGSRTNMHIVVVPYVERCQDVK